MPDGTSTPVIDPVNVEWREHPTLPGFRVSNTGRVQSRWVLRSLGRRGTRGTLGEAWHDLKLQTLPSGYVYIQVPRRLLHGGSGHKRTTVYAHSLVAECFIGPRPAGQDVRHENNDPSDNRSTNLIYGTRAENMADQLRHGTRRFGSRHQNAKLTEDDVREIIALLLARIPPSVIAERKRVSQSTVENIRSGKAWPLVTRPGPIPNLRKRSSPARP